MNQNCENSADLKIDIIQRLSSIEAKLLSINTESETDFLRLGMKLQTGYSSVVALTEKTRDTALLIGASSEESALSTIETCVNHSLEALKKSRENVISKSNPVQDIVGSLDGLNLKRNEIELIAKYLRAVALNIVIETSRSEISSENFSIIAQEIKVLSGNILDLAKNIRKESEESKTLFSLIYSDISEGIKQMSSLTEHAEHSVKDAIEKAEELMIFSMAVVEQAGVRSQTIMDQVGQIVMGVQFHDNMRQRIEHVVSGLDNIVNLCRGTREASGEKENKNLGKAHAITLLQAAQINKIIEEIDTIYKQNSKAFENIITEISLLTKNLTQLISGGDKSGRIMEKETGPLNLLQSALLNFRNLEDQATALENKLTDTYKQASQTAESLSTQAEKIHDISRVSHIKALNALIAARHLGDEGRPLSVLAEEMKLLSDQAETFVMGVEVIIDSIVSKISSITSDVETEVKTDKPETESTLNDTISTISEIYGRMNKSSELLFLDAEKLNTVLAEAENSLDFLPAMADKIQQQLNGLHEISELLTPWADKTIQTHITDRYMAEKYTMEKERMIHRESTETFSKDLTGKDKNLELLDKEPAKQSEDDDLGDNIELF